MSRIRSKGSKPELQLRRLIHGLGYRYRLHVKDLPGKPDLVFPGRKKIIFLHGCFWHQHEGCKDSRIPDSRRDYWEPKLGGNVTRDRQHEQALGQMGWKVLTVWECDLRRREQLVETIENFLNRN